MSAWQSWSTRGLVGKVTAPVLPNRANVMLHPRHPLRHVGEDRARRAAGDDDHDGRTDGDDDSDVGAARGTDAVAASASGIDDDVEHDTTTIDTTNNRDTGQLRGRGPDQLPQVDLLDDSPVFGRIVEGDIVLTAGGTESLAPPDIPVGIVRNVVNRSSAEGPLLEIETLADLDRLHFVTRRALQAGVRGHAADRHPGRRLTCRARLAAKLLVSPPSSPLPLRSSARPTSAGRLTDAGVARAGPVAAAVLRRPRCARLPAARSSPTCARRACRSR